MNILVSYDASVAGAPVGFKEGVAAAVAFIDSIIPTNVTVTINVGFGEVDGHPVTALGQSEFFLVQTTYAQLFTALPGILPATDPTNGGPLLITSAEARGLGIASLPNVDGFVGFSSTLPLNYDLNDRSVPGKYDFVAVVEHEITEVLGRISLLNHSEFAVPDLLRYSAPGVHNLVPTTPGYFSLDNGVTNLNFFNTNPAGDFGDWAPSAGNDMADAFAQIGVENIFSASDIAEMRALYGVKDIPLVTPSDIQRDYLGVLRVPLDIVNATVQANAINSHQTTEQAYVDTLIVQAHDTTQPAIAVEATMYGAVGTSDEVTKLVTQFLPAQIATAHEHGFNSTVYASEALGLAFAFGDEHGNITFAKNFGPTSIVSDLTYAAAAVDTIFDGAATQNLVNVVDRFVENWKAFYTANGIPGFSNPTANDIDLAARGAAWGDAVGVALENNLGPLHAEVVDFLHKAAAGTAVYSAPLTLLV